MNFFSTILNRLGESPKGYKKNYLNKVRISRESLRKNAELKRSEFIGVVCKNPYRVLPFLLACIAEGHVPVVFPSLEATKKCNLLLPIKHGLIHNKFGNFLSSYNYRQLGWRKLSFEKPSSINIPDLPKATLQEQPCIVFVIMDEYGNFTPSGWTHNELTQLFVSLNREPYEFFQFLLNHANLTPSSLWLKYANRFNQVDSRFHLFNDWSSVSKWSLLST